MVNLMKMFSSKENFEYRKSICDECEYKETLLNRCKLCGCFLSLKQRVGNQSCPILKWGNNYNTWSV
jgi:hypothetical protein